MTDKKLKAITPLRSAIHELLNHEAEERVERIEKEFKAGFEKVNSYINTVTVFGSTRFLDDNQYYKQARKLGSELANIDFTVTTGGGGGMPNGGQLPNGWTYRFSISQLLDLDGNNYAEDGVPPDILVSFDWTDLTKDEIIERAIQEIE